MSRLRADVVVSKNGYNPFTASEGIIVASGKTVSLGSNCTISGDTSTITSNVGNYNTINVNQVYLDDSGKTNYGTSQDLQIYHDGSNNYLDCLNGSLNIRTNATENSIVASPNGSVELYYDDSKKVETTSTGAFITGGVISTDGWKGTTSPSNVLGGIAMSFVCGRNGRIALPSVNTTMLFGGSEYTDDNTEGIVMPHNGKLVSATLHSENVEGSSVIEVLLNNVRDSDYQFNIVKPIRGNFNQIRTWYDTPLSFSAGDRINFSFASTSIVYMEVLSITFFVVFD